MMGFAELRLTLPQQNISVRPEEVSRLSREFGQLVSSGVSFAMRPDLITTHLHNLNRMELTGDERYLLCYKLVYQVMAEKDQLRRSLSPAMLIDLNAEAGFAAKLLLKDCPSHSVEEKAQFTHWVLFSLSEQIRDHYERYKTEPKVLWGEIHRIYEYAMLHRISDFKTHPLNVSIEHSYKLAIMTAASEPYHFNLTEARVLFQWLNRWSDKCTISNQISRNRNQAYFYVNLSLNEGVLSHSQSEQYLANDYSVLAINPLPLISLAKEHMAFLKSAGKKEDIGIDIPVDSVDCYVTLKKAALSWSHNASRKDNRQQCHQDVSLIIGLKQVHGFLKSPSKEMIRPVKGVELNNSRGGACIEIGESEAQNANVGDIIFENANENSQKLGVIKWLKRSAETMILGIEFIIGKTQPVAINIKNKITNALLVSSAQNDTLLARTGVYKNGTPFYVKIPHRQQALAAISGPLVNRHGRTDQFKIIRGNEH